MAKKTGRKSPSKKTQIPTNLPEQVRYHFIKSNAFRVFYVDGAHGGITPKGQIQIALFNERHPIPQQIVHKLDADGSLGDVIAEETVGRQGIVREVEAEAIMTLETAKSLIAWLSRSVKQLEKLRTQAAPKAKKTR